MFLFRIIQSFIGFCLNPYYDDRVESVEKGYIYTIISTGTVLNLH